MIAGLVVLALCLAFKMSAQCDYSHILTRVELILNYGKSFEHLEKSPQHQSELESGLLSLTGQTLLHSSSCLWIKPFRADRLYVSSSVEAHYRQCYEKKKIL